jgi:two-component system response regulator
VEDNPDDRELTLRALKRSRPQQTVVAIEDGAEAIEYLREGGHAWASTSRDTPALVILDLKMPKIDGLELLKRLRKEPSTRLLPVVILTSSSERRDVNEAYQLGANSYLTKPVEFERFLEMVDCMCRYWLDLNQGSGG